MVIGLLILLPVIAIITGFFTLKAYERGLRHNYELKHDIKPIEKPSVIETIFNVTTDKKQEEEAKSLFNEYYYGEE